MKVRAGKKKKTNWIKNMLCLAVMLCGLCGSLRVEASGTVTTPIQIDNFTGEVMSGVQVEKNEIQVHAGCVYDKSADKFIYTADEASGLKVISTVADGMVTNYGVSLEYGTGTDFVLYKDGIKLEGQDVSAIKQVGSYVLQYKGRKVLEFRIIGEYSTIEFFNAPNGFYIQDVQLDGEGAQFSHGSAGLSGEGTYAVSYVCEATGKSYSFKTTADRTAPELVLEELDEKGRARGPVDLSDREANSILKITLDGEEIKVSDTLTQSGRYVVTIADSAGNYNTYNFTIMIYFNTSSITFFILILAVIGGISAYIIISSKRLKVF